MSYRRISNFGDLKSQPSNDPLTYIMVDTLDKGFLHGSNARNYGPYDPMSQAYLTERCSKNWDGFCQYYYLSKNTQQYPFFGNVNQQGGNTMLMNGITAGESLLGASAQRRFCDFEGCVARSEPFDPNVADSPCVTYFESYKEDGSSCLPICRVDKTTIDDDVVMNSCLNNPKACYQTMINICNTASREGTDLSGTKIGEWCSQYKKGFPMSSTPIGAYYIPGNSSIC